MCVKTKQCFYRNRARKKPVRQKTKNKLFIEPNVVYANKHACVSLKTGSWALRAHVNLKKFVNKYTCNQVDVFGGTYLGDKKRLGLLTHSLRVRRNT